MNFYPAIDLKDGKCIRLKKGELKDITFYNPNPVDQASKFIEMGAKWIHMVDIEGRLKVKISITKYLMTKKKNLIVIYKLVGALEILRL